MRGQTLPIRIADELHGAAAGPLPGLLHAGAGRGPLLRCRHLDRARETGRRQVHIPVGAKLRGQIEGRGTYSISLANCLTVPPRLPHRPHAIRANLSSCIVFANDVYLIKSSGIY